MTAKAKKLPDKQWEEQVHAIQGHLDKLSDDDAMTALIVLTLTDVCDQARDLHEARGRIAAIAGWLNERLDDMWRDRVCKTV